MDTKTVRYILWVVDALLVAVVLWVVVQTLASPVGAGPEAKTPPPPPAGLVNIASQPLGDGELREMMTSGAIIPKPTVATPRPRPSAKPAPQDEDIAKAFKYKLIGTVLEKDASFAFFEDSSGRQSVVAQGQAIGDARVIGVWGNRVLIEIRGKRGYIEQTKPEARVMPKALASNIFRPMPGIIPVPPSGGETEEAEEPAEEDEEDFEDIDWDVLSEAQFQDYLQNLGKYVSEVSTISHFDENKKPDGLLLSKVPKTSEAYKRGLRRGDIVKSVQDVPVTDLQTVMKTAYGILKDNDYLVDVLIIRDGREEVLSYEIWPE